MATIGSAKATLVDKIDSLTASATAKDTIYLAKALKENTTHHSFTYLGAWAATTAYAVDDVVITGGQTYICILSHVAPGSFVVGAHWDLLASKGIDGSNGASGIPSGGSVGQVVTNTGAGAGGWADAAGGGKLLKTYTFENNTRAVPSSSTAWVSLYSGSFTKISATSTIVLNVITSGFGEHQHGAKQKFTLGTGTSNQTVCTFPHGGTVSTALPGQLIITGNTQTGSLSWDYYWMRRPCTIINPNGTDSGEVGTQTYSTITIWEIEA